MFGAVKHALALQGLTTLPPDITTEGEREAAGGRGGEEGSVTVGSKRAKPETAREEEERMARQQHSERADSQQIAHSQVEYISQPKKGTFSLPKRGDVGQ